MAEARYDGPTEPRPLIGVATRFSTGAGAPLTVRVAVTNPAPVARVISVAAVGTDPGWGGAPQRTGVLEPGASAVVAIVLTPPVGTLPAQYPLVIAAQALDPATGRPAPAATGSAEAVLVVDPRAQLDLDLQPRELSMVGSRRFSVVLRNGGAEAATVRLILKSSTHVSFSLRKEEVRVGPGASVTVRGRARIRRPQMVGPRMPHPFTVTARGTESVKHVDGQVVQRAAVGTSVVKAVALLLVLAVWVGAAVVFIPSLADKVRTSSEESAAADGPGSQTDQEDAGEAGADAGDDAGGGAEGDDPADAGDDAGTEGAADEDGLQLSGSVAGTSPDDVSVTLAATSLVDEEAQGGVGVGVPSSALDGQGMRPVAAFLQSSARTSVPDRSVRTAADGSWAFPSVRAPGYYLVTFAKPGFQTERYVVDAGSEAAREPLEVDLLPGEGAMSGRITGPDGAVGGATITLTDGTNTVTTTSNSRGKGKGDWSIEGLSTPSTYVVTAGGHGLSSESQVVHLDAGEQATASLELVPGVATLTGVVKVPDGPKNEKRLGGLTVTVSDGAGNVRTASTLSDPRGQYSVPGLAIPGRYSVTVSGDGYQPQTARLRLGSDAGVVKHDVSLSSAYGTVDGVVSSAPAGTTRRAARRAGTGVPLPNVGLTLANADHTYKTTSSTDDAGAYEFTGVAPGSYVLTTQYFGKVTANAAVEVAAGGFQTRNLLLAEQPGAGIPADAVIRGSIIDASTGLPLPKCAVADCVVAEVSDPGVLKEGKVVDAGTYCDRFGGEGEQYVLPDPNAGTCLDGTPSDSDSGLHAGLHTVTVSVPGYETGTVRVTVTQSGKVEAPVLELYPAPAVSGVVSARRTVDPEGQYPRTCVWVVKGKVNADQVKARHLPACGPTTTPAACLNGKAPYTGLGSTTEWCAISDSTGHYQVQTPRSGEYSVFVDPVSDQIDNDNNRVVQLDLDRGEVAPVNWQLDRYGVLELTVSKPAPGSKYVAAGGATLRVEPALADGTTTATVPASGELDLPGLQFGQTYQISGEVAVDVPGDPTSGTRTTLGGVTELSVPHNQSLPGVLRLRDPIKGVVGRVVGTIDGQPVPLEGARIDMQAVQSYTDTGAATLGDPFQITTDRLGCFGVHSTEDPARLGPCAGLDWVSNASLVDRAMASNRASSLVISAEGYATETHADGYDLSSVVLNGFTLTPGPVKLAATVHATHGSTPPAWSSVKVTATPRYPGTASAPTPVPSLSVAPVTDEPSKGMLTTAGGTLRAGRYDVRLELDNYRTVTGVLSCVPGKGCGWVTTPTEGSPEGPAADPDLVEHGTVKILVEDEAHHGIALASVKLGTNGDGVLTDGTGTGTTLGQAVFARIESGLVTLPVTVSAPGFRPGRAGAAGGAVTLDCAADDGPGGFYLAAGGTTTCVATVHVRLATVSGSLTGFLGRPADDVGTADDDRRVERLTSARVTVDECTDATCDALKPSGISLTTTTTLPTAGQPTSGGQFTFRGTAAVPGLEEGYYRLEVPTIPAGYESTASDGRLREIVHIGADLASVGNRSLRVYPTDVDVEVTVTDTQHRAVTDGLVWLSTNENSTAPAAGEPSSQNRAVYSLEDVLPGYYTLFVSAPGIPRTGRTLKVEANGSTTLQRVPLVVARSGGDLSGRATTRESGSSAGLGGATVTLRCAPSSDTTEPRTPTHFCNGAGPALALDDRPLETTTSDAAGARGSFTFTSVPSGRYEISISKPGYGTNAVTVLVRSTSQSLTDPVELTFVERTVKITVTPSDPDDDLAGTTARLVGLDSSLSYDLQWSQVGGEWVASSVSGVRWGCYRLELTPPTGHHARPGAVTGAAAPTGCASGADVRVPADLPSGTVPDLTGTAALDEGRLDVSLTRDPWLGHAPPATTVRLTSGSRSYDVLVTDGTAASPEPTTYDSSSSPWLPPGTYQVAVQLPPGEAAFWDVQADASVTIGGSGDHELDVSVVERTFRVPISIPSLPATEVPEFQVGDTLGRPVPDITVEHDGTGYYVLLPRGSWDVDAAWTSGPYASASVTVTGSGSPAVVLVPAPPPAAAPADPAETEEPADPEEPEGTESP